MSPAPHGDSAISGVIDRPRLYAVLDAPDICLCVVEGASGTGKTTLVRSWVSHRAIDTQVLWISLNDIVWTRIGFWEYVAATVVRSGQMSSDAAAVIGAQLQAAIDPVSVAIPVLNRSRPITLVLDAYEHLGPVQADVDSDLARLLSAVPTLRVVVTTRGRTALSDYDAGHRLVRVLSSSELAFTFGEVRELLTAQTGIADEQFVTSVLTATKGFALTVRSVVLAVSQLGRIPHLHSLEWDEVVAARFESLLPDPSVRQFVVDTSVPPYVDPRLASELSGHDDAGAILEHLERNGFGRWIPYAVDRPVFQYVETIRDTFRARARADTFRFNRACSTTALWLLNDSGGADQALQFAIEGRDYALADRAYVSLVITNPDSYTSDWFLPVLRCVPRQLLSEYPMLAFGLGLALMANPLLRAEAPEIFRIAATSDAHPHYIEPIVDRFSITSMQAIATRLAGDYRKSAADAEQAVAILDEIDPAALAASGEHVGTVLRQLSYSLLLGRRITRATTVIGTSFSLCPSPTTQNYSLVYAAGIQAVAGNTLAARSLLASVNERAWPAERRQSYMDAMGSIAAAYIKLDLLDFAGAADILQHSAVFTTTTEFWPLLTSVSLAARTGLGQGPAEAERITRELAAALPPPTTGDNFASDLLRGLLAMCWLAHGEERKASEALTNVAAPSIQLAPAQLALLLARQQDREAYERLPAILDDAEHTVRSLAESQSWGAVAALRQGHTEAAWTWLNAASLAWESYGPRLHVAYLPAQDRRRLIGLAREREAGRVEEFLRVPGAGVSRPRDVVLLSPREQIVLEQLAQHSSVKAIAEALVVSHSTVKSHLQRIYRKLGVSSRSAALAVADDLGMLPRKSR